MINDKDVAQQIKDLTEFVYDKFIEIDARLDKLESSMKTSTDVVGKLHLKDMFNPKATIGPILNDN